MSSDLAKLKERFSRLERKVRRIDEVLALLPESIDPLTWKSLDSLDKEILSLLLHKDTALSTTELSDKIPGVHRTKIWRRMKKISRASRKLKGDSIIVFDPSSKKWSLNTEDFDFKQLEEKP